MQVANAVEGCRQSLEIATRALLSASIQMHRSSTSNLDIISFSLKNVSLSNWIYGKNMDFNGFIVIYCITSNVNFGYEPK